MWVESHGCDMIRPEIDDENVERLNEIIDATVSVPLTSDDLSINKQLEILTKAVYEEVEEARKQGENVTTVIDDYDRRD
jgi:hypothetical protein